MISSTRWRCAISSFSAGPTRSSCQQEAALHLQGAAGHDVVERAHALEQRDVLEGARDAAARRRRGAASCVRVSPLKVMRPCCGW